MRLGSVVAALSLAGVFTVGLAWYLIYAATYAPLGAGNFGGPAMSADAAALSASSTEPRRITGGAGTEVRILIGLVNDGPFGVHIDGIVLSDVQVRAQWSPYHLSPGGLGSGDERPARDFGAPLPAHHQIRVIITLRQPDCTHQSLAGQYFNTITVKWHSIGRSHQTPVRTDPSEPGLLQYCP
jgi:hypothetical protein